MCDPRTADHQVGPTTPMAPMTSRSGLRWCSSAPLSCWIYPRTVTAQWSELECKNFISLPPRPSSLWLPASMCWGESRSSPVSGREHDMIYYHPQVRSESAPMGHIPIWHHWHRFVQRSRQDGEQCVRGELVAMAVWETQRTVELSSRQTVKGIMMLLRPASSKLSIGMQSDLALKKAGCTKVYHVYSILI